MNYLLIFHYDKRPPKSCMELLHKKFLINIILILKNEPLAFNEIQSQLKIYSDTLSRRLKELENLGIIDTTIIQGDTGKRIRYKLTSKGNVIVPFLVEAMKALKKAEDLL